MAIARAFPDGGGYEWKGTGVPEDVRFNDKIILAKGKATYCSGFTFAVAMKAAAERGLLKNKTIEQVRRFRKNGTAQPKKAAKRNVRMRSKNWASASRSPSKTPNQATSCNSGDE